MPDRARRRPAVATVDVVLRSYQLVFRPILGSTCRFAPSCSEYARDAVRRHGVLGGLRLAAKRIARCHPLTPGGWDPVPDRMD